MRFQYENISSSCSVTFEVCSTVDLYTPVIQESHPTILIRRQLCTEMWSEHNSRRWVKVMNHTCNLNLFQTFTIHCISFWHSSYRRTQIETKTLRNFKNINKILDYLVNFCWLLGFHVAGKDANPGKAFGIGLSRKRSITRSWMPKRWQDL